MTVLLGFNDDDVFWQTHATHIAQHEPHFFHVKYVFMPLPYVVRDGKTVSSMINITNTLVHHAYQQGAEYIVRVNDDTEFISKGWLTNAVKVLQSYSPPNVGVVGPVCRQGNTDILTHDMVHRTHMQIFETYWPPYFVNWYGDTWITDVYKGVQRLTVLPTWKVNHNTNRHGTRYKPFIPSEQKYKLLVNVGIGRIQKFIGVHNSTFVAFTSTQPVHMLMKKEIQDQVAYIKSMEKELWQHMTQTLHAMCTLPNALFVDSGANEGTWSLMAASYGCRVVAVEPQPLCVYWLRQEVTMNHMDNRVNIYNNVLSNQNFSVEVNNDVCSGTSQYKSDGTVVDAFDQKVVKQHTQNVSAIQLTQLVPNNAVIIMWHLDTEGAEITVLQSAQPLLQTGRICQIIVEWLPAQWIKFNVSVEEGAQVAQHLLQNYVCTNGCNKNASFTQKQGGGSVCNSHRDIYCALVNPPSHCT